MRDLIKNVSLVILGLLWACFALPVQAQSADDVVLYTVKSGDTLIGLADRYFIKAPSTRASIKIVQQANKIGNADRIRTGFILRIPRSVLSFRETNGQLLSWRGVVQIWSGGAAGTPQKGLPVREPMIIETGGNSSAVIALANGSRVSIPSQSRVQILRMRQYVLGNAIDYDLVVLKGRLETQATKLPNGDSRYRVRTPTSVTAVRGTDFRVKFQGDENKAGDVSTEVSEGDVAVNVGQRSDPEALAKGQAIAVTPGLTVKRGTLIAPPVLSKAGRLQTADTLSFPLERPDGAVRFMGTISSDASGDDVVAESLSDQPNLAFADLADGVYYLRLTAENQEGFEGFARTYRVIRAKTGLKSSLSKLASGNILFKWLPVGDGAAADPSLHYRFQLRSATPGSAPLVDRSALKVTSIELSTLPPGTWLWRVGITRMVEGERIDVWGPSEELVIDGK
jgi:hypothetical protein